MDGSSELDLVVLGRWFAALRAPATLPLTAFPISGGHANLTYRLEDAEGRAYAMRMPPSGDLPPGAHDVLREARIIRGLASTHVPVPAIAGTCSDPELLGRPFFVMDWIDGNVVAAPADARRFLVADSSRHVAAQKLVDVLAELHAVDVVAADMGDLARPGDYIERQLRRMWMVWERTHTRELPEMADLHGRLLHSRPAQRHGGLVHGDYRLGNVMIDRTGQIVAVLDWELAAIGDVMCDLAFLVNNWESADEPHAGVWMQEPPTRAGGFPDRTALIERYAARTGFDVSHLDYYRAFVHWRMAVIAEGIKRRYESGAMTAARHAGGESAAGAVDFDHLERRVRVLAGLADQHLTQAGA